MRLRFLKDWRWHALLIAGALGFAVLVRADWYPVAFVVATMVGRWCGRIEEVHEHPAESKARGFLA